MAAGNSVVAVAPNAREALRPLIGKDMRLAAVDGAPDEALLREADLVALNADAGTLRRVRRLLAERSGPIVPLVVETIYPAAYAHERAVCMDTTAAGGNASLLAAGL